MRALYRSPADYPASSPCEARDKRPRQQIPHIQSLVDSVLEPFRRVSIACAFLTYAACAIGASLAQDDARESLVATERAFARYAFEHGIRPAFIEFFAEDGINFQPGPVNTREAYRARPPSDPKRLILEWHPVLAGVASAGDLGFTSGPSTLTDRSTERPETHHGLLFSVWRRDEAGV